MNVTKGIKAGLNIGVLLLSFIVFSQYENLFQEGNNLYNQGKYQEALIKYQEIVTNNVHSAELYYNIGNAYYKLNQIAESIYYYEKSLVLNPNDKDVLNNLQYANNMTIDVIEELPQIGLNKLFQPLFNSFSFHTWAILSLIFMVLFIIAFLYYYFSVTQIKKRFYFSISFICLFSVIASFSIALHLQNVFQKDRPAIISTEETIVMSEPNVGSNQIFKLHEGTKVNVLEVLGNWKKIKLSDGKIGWLPTQEIKEIKDF